MAMAAVSADVFVPRLEEKHEEPPEKKQNKTDEERQEEEDAPNRGDDDDDDDDCFPGELPEMTRAEYFLYHQQVNESGKKNFKFKEVVKANVQPVEGLMYYITFKAEDASTATMETFQTKVWRGIGFVEVIFIRVKPISISKQGNEGLAICCSRSS
ncbi:hypothetical protein CFP56_014255 [Quercus suber]|uniref:Cystatin domain-containing protein n=1 Tax=Quercus suber TaxID=58331 RepID=A0AAW0KUG5_QUESU